MRKLLKYIIPLAVSIGLCVVMFRSIDFTQMLHIISHDCAFAYIGIMLAMALPPMIFRALRWDLQLRAAGIKAPIHVLIYSIVGTYAVNLVFPRLGEVWRTGYVAYRQKASFSTVFGSMVADRFADLVTVALLTLGTFVVASGPITDFVKAYPAAYELIARVLTSPITWVAMLLCVALAWLYLARSKGGVAEKVRGFVRGLWEGFAAIARMKGKLLWLGLTVTIWGTYFLQLAVAFNAFEATAQVMHTHGIVAVLVCYILTTIAMGIPSNGGIGPYQIALLFGLQIFAPASMTSAQATTFTATATAFGNVIIASQTLLLIVLGLITFALIALDKRRR